MLQSYCSSAFFGLSTNYKHICILYRLFSVLKTSEIKWFFVIVIIICAKVYKNGREKIDKICWFNHIVCVFGSSEWIFHGNSSTFFDDFFFWIPNKLQIANRQEFEYSILIVIFSQLIRVCLCSCTETEFLCLYLILFRILIFSPFCFVSCQTNRNFLASLSHFSIVSFSINSIQAHLSPENQFSLRLILTPIRFYLIETDLLSILFVTNKHENTTQFYHECILLKKFEIRSKERRFFNFSPFWRHLLKQFSFSVMFALRVSCPIFSISFTFVIW